MATPVENRRPVRIEGMAKGITTLRTRRRPRRPNDWAASTTLRSTFRTPFEVLRYIGNSVASAIRRYFETSPIPDPHDEQEDYGGEGDGAEHLHRGVDELLAEGPQADDDPEDQPDRRSDGQADRRPGDRDPEVPQQVLVGPEIDEGVPGRRRRGELGRRHQPRAGQRPPQPEDGDRHRSPDGQAHPAVALPLLPDHRPDQPGDGVGRDGSVGPAGGRSLVLAMGQVGHRARGSRARITGSAPRSRQPSC